MLLKHLALLLLALWILTATQVSSAADTSRDNAELRLLLKQAILEDSGFEDQFAAQVWLLDMTQRLERFVPNTKTRIEILKRIHYEARRANLDPELVLALIEVESHFDQFAISVSGARGLMQVMPFWLDEIGISDKNLFKIRTNLRMGCTILRYYIDMEPDNLTRALARYNGSLGKNTYPNKIFKALRVSWYRQ